MKIAFTADWHLRGNDLATTGAQLNALVDECLLQHVELIGVAGDTFDRPTIGDNHASTGAIAAVAIAAVKRLTYAGVNVLMIPGNHDQAGAGSADALHVFDGMERVEVSRMNDVSDQPDAFIICIPWNWSGQNPQSEINTLVSAALHTAKFERKKLILMAHIQVIGARMAGSFTCDAAPGKWQVSREFLESLPVDHIALGDFHARQELVTGRGGYVGALRQCNFGEEGNPAGFEIYDTATGKTEWIELDAAPKHRTVTITEGVAAFAHQIGELVKLRYDGVIPDPVEVRQLEASGVVVEQIVDREERIQRADVPEGILHDRHGLMRLWAASQNPPVEGERLDGMIQMHDTIFADKEMAL